MAAKFLLKIYRFSEKDIFCMDEPVSSLTVYCKSSVELRSTIRFFSPSGYRVRSAHWFRKHIKRGGAVMETLFKTKRFEVIPAKIPVAIDKTYAYKNEKQGTTLQVKLANSKSWEYNNNYNNLPI